MASFYHGYLQLSTMNFGTKLSGLAKDRPLEKAKKPDNSGFFIGGAKLYQLYRTVCRFRYRVMRGNKNAAQKF